MNDSRTARLLAAPLAALLATLLGVATLLLAAPAYAAPGVEAAKREVAAANQALERAQVAYRNAVSDRSDASTVRSRAVTARKAAAARKSQDAAAVATAKTKRDNLAAASRKAETRLREANATMATKQEALDSAVAELAAARLTKDAAQRTLETRKEDVKKAWQAVASAKKSQKRWEDMVIDARRRWLPLENYRNRVKEANKAAREVTATRAKVDTAQDQRVAAAEALTDAKERLTSATAQQKSAAAKVTEYKRTVMAASKNAAAKKAALAPAQKAVSSASSRLSQSKATLNRAAAAAAQAQKNYSAADRRVSVTAEQVSAASVRVRRAKASLSAAQASAARNNLQPNSGSAGGSSSSSGSGSGGGNPATSGSSADGSTGNAAQPAQPEWLTSLPTEPDPNPQPLPTPETSPDETAGAEQGAGDTGEDTGESGTPLFGDENAFSSPTAAPDEVSGNGPSETSTEGAGDSEISGEEETVTPLTEVETDTLALRDGESISADGPKSGSGPNMVVLFGVLVLAAAAAAGWKFRPALGAAHGSRTDLSAGEGLHVAEDDPFAVTRSELATGSPAPSAGPAPATTTMWPPARPTAPQSTTPTPDAHAHDATPEGSSAPETAPAAHGGTDVAAAVPGRFPGTAPAVVTAVVRDAAGQVLLVHDGHAWGPLATPASTGVDPLTDAANTLRTATGWPVPDPSTLDADVLSSDGFSAVVEIRLPGSGYEVPGGMWGTLDQALEACPGQAWTTVIAG